jgi:hypothetical protein
LASETPFEAVLNFQVAAPSWFFEGTVGLFFLFHELVGHATEEKSKLRPFPTEWVGHPEIRCQSLPVDSVNWYHPVVRDRPQIIFERLGHQPKVMQFLGEGRYVANVVEGKATFYGRRD